MHHFVLTRSVYTAQWSRKANRRRLDLLRGVTVPSMAAQEAEWSWVVLLDASDPNLIDRQTAFRRAGVPVHFLFANRGITSTESKARTAALAYRQAPWWSALVTGKGEVTLTTRLDDDDAFAPDALARIQAAADPDATERVALMLPNGYRVWDGKYDRVRHERNAWVTLQAPPGDPAVVYDFNHKRIAEYVDVRMVDDEPGWLWVRHGDTLSRHFKARKPINQRLRKTFPIDWNCLGG